MALISVRRCDRCGLRADEHGARHWRMIALPSRVDVRADGSLVIRIEERTLEICMGCLDQLALWMDGSDARIPKKVT